MPTDAPQLDVELHDGAYRHSIVATTEADFLTLSPFQALRSRGTSTPAAPSPAAIGPDISGPSLFMVHAAIGM
jgi:hypothetical protein